jgi:hypothetical protein
MGLLTHCPLCGKIVSPKEEADARPQAVYIRTMTDLPSQRPGAVGVSVDPKKGAGSKADQPQEKPCLLAIASQVAGFLSLLMLNFHNLRVTSRSWGGPVASVVAMAAAMALSTAGVVIGAIVLIKKMPGRSRATVGVFIGGLVAATMLGLLAYSVVSGDRWFIYGFSLPPRPAAVTPGPPGGYAGITIQEPPVLDGEEIADLLNGPLNIKVDAEDAALYLRWALEKYPIRRQEPGNLSWCVNCFRKYLANSGTTKPSDPEHAKMFATACDELTDRVLADYRRAGQLEHDGKWKQAEDVYDEMLEYLTGPDDPLWQNVIKRRTWCNRKYYEENTRVAK